VNRFRAFAGAIVLMLVSGMPLHAQSRTSSSAVEAAITRARALLDAGEGTAARVLLDSIVGAQQGSSIELAEALYWRAVMAESVSEAEQDWKRLLVEAPLADRAAEALLRLAELELMRGHATVARQYSERMLRDHASSPNRPHGLFWLARSWFAENNPANGCSTLSELRGVMPQNSPELRLQSEDLQLRCRANATPAPTTARSTTTAAAASAAQEIRGRFSVQLAAYARLEDASAMVKRLAAQGIEARVDGTANPFRVRTGYYATQALAAQALEQLARKGHKGFVAEITP